MKAYLIFSMRTLSCILKNQFYFSKKNLFVTDKIIIFNLLKEKKYKIELLEKKINTETKNKILKKNYFPFSKKLQVIGNKNFLNIDNLNLNTVFSNFRGIAPRSLVGVKVLFFTLNKIVKSHKVKELVYFKDIGDEYFEEEFYTTLINFFCKKKKIKFIQFSLPKKKFFFQNILKFVSVCIFFFKEVNFYNLKIYLKKFISKIIFFVKKQYIFIEPANDLLYSNYNLLNTKFIKFESKYNLSLENLDFLKLEKKLEDIFYNYILKKNELINKQTYTFIKFLKNKNLKKNFYFWCMGPNLIKKSLYHYISRKSKIFGLQHGGKQLLLEGGEIFNIDEEYSFCKKFLSYGFSQKFLKKNNIPLKKIQNLGCLKTNYQEKILSNYKINQQNILYVPIALSSFLRPTLEILAWEKFKEQKNLCSYLSKLDDFKIYVKIIPFSYFKNILLNEQKSYLNPIVHELNNYKTFKICNSSLINEIVSNKPRIIIFDSISTPLYEALASKSELILIKDKFCRIEYSTLKLMKKRVFVVKNFFELRKVVNLIKKNKISKLNNNEFYLNFYKLKKNLFNYEKFI